MSAEATAYVWANSPYKANKMLIHLAIADVVNDGYQHRFFMTNNNLAEKCNATRQTINGAIKEFVEDGFLEVVKQFESGVVEYRFLYPEVGEKADTPVKILDTPVKEFDTPPVKEFDTPVKNFDTEQETNTTNTTKAEPNQTLFSEESETGMTRTQQRNAVWDAYITSWHEFNKGKNGRVPVYSHARKELINRRLEVYSVDDLILAVTGWRFSAHHMGENDQNTVYNSIDLFLRNDEKIEMFIGYHDKKKPVSKGNVNDAHGRTRDYSNDDVIELDGDDDEDFIDD